MDIGQRTSHILRTHENNKKKTKVEEKRREKNRSLCFSSWKFIFFLFSLSLELSRFLTHSIRCRWFVLSCGHALKSFELNTNKHKFPDQNHWVMANLFFLGIIEYCLLEPINANHLCIQLFVCALNWKIQICNNHRGIEARDRIPLTPKWNAIRQNKINIWITKWVRMNAICGSWLATEMCMRAICVCLRASKRRRRGKKENLYTQQEIDYKILA